jgi:hypothetical protein
MERVESSVAVESGNAVGLLFCIVPDKRASILLTAEYSKYAEFLKVRFSFPCIQLIPRYLF